MTAPLSCALDPRSIAIIGASENPDKIGGRPLLYLSRFGYRGRVYPINPVRALAQGYRTYPDLDALPEAPEMAIVAVPGDAAVAAVQSCAERGVKVAIIMASGFGETASADGRASERRMVDVGRTHSMRLIGPNSQGLANFGTGTVASFSSMFIEEAPADGPLAIISQSGSMSVVPYGLLRRRGIGVRHAHAIGNQADVTVSELAITVAADPAVELLLLYFESIPDPGHLAEAALVARERGLPIVALKAGRTAAGQQAAQSHTGALATEDRIVDALFERLGIWRAQDVFGLVDAAELYLKGWAPAGKRLVAVSNAGATCVMVADAATTAGMPLAALAPQTRAALDDLLPSFATTTNPIDVTAALLTNGRLLGDILPIIARDPAADVFLIGIPVAGAAYDLDGFARDTAALAALTGKPVVVAASQPSVAAPFRAAGLTTFELETQAVAALDQFVSHYQLIARTRHRDPPAFPTRGQRPFDGSALNEPQTLALVAQHGLRVVPHRLCHSEAEAVAAFHALGGTVAVKGCSAEVAHKTELGLVILGLTDEAAVAAAYHRITSTLQRHGHRYDGVIVALMAVGRHEMMIGARRDPIFGPIVLIGEGGKYVEALPDVRTLLPPIEPDDVRRALYRLRIAPLLDGARGEPPLDVTAFCAATVAVSRMMMHQSLGVMTLDLNPILLSGAGEGYVVIDAMATVASA